MIVRLSLTLVAAVAPLLHGASTKTWEITDYDHFLSGKLERLSVSKEGSLSVGPALTKLFESSEAVVWTSARGSGGDLYIGTGHQGRLYKIDSSGKSELLWDAPEIEIFALAVGDNGDVYAGTSPNGKVYRIDSKGEAKEFFDPKAKYIWSLVIREKDLFVATGDEGKVYRVDASGDGEEYFNSKQRHAISLALDQQGRLLVGTDPNGVVYRVDAKGKAFGLYDAELPEVRSMHPNAAGEILVGAMGGAQSLLDQTVQTVTAAATFTVTATAGASGSAPQPIQTPLQATPAAASQPIVSYGIETTALLRIRPEKGVDKLWSSTEENILAVSAAPGDAESLLFATDRLGRIYRWSGGDKVALVTQTDQQQITSLLAADAGVIATTAHSGIVYRLEPGRADDGVYETGVHDAGTVARWGHLRWRGGGQLEFHTRSGNSFRPDDTWSVWSAAIEGAEGGPIASPGARYLQWRVKLSGDAIVESAEVSYLPRNRRPTIASITVKEEAAAGSTSSTSDASSSSADTSSVYSITVSASGTGTSSASSAKQQSVSGAGDTKLAVSWTAVDADGDDLRAKVEFRGEDETAWKTIKEDVTEGKITIDSESLADGRYRFRVEVSDALSNPAASAETAEKTSESILIDHTAPAVRLVETQGREAALFEATDGASMLERAGYSIDAGPWRPIYSDDGILDSRNETFTIRLSDLAEGERLLTIRVRDAAGNAGLAKAVIE